MPATPPPGAATACTRCGCCLESCPTYTLSGAELESPRGRIALIEDALLGHSAITAAVAAHIDSCVGCLACVTACPEGVPYSDLLAWVRVAVERDAARPLRERVRREAALAAPTLNRRGAAWAHRGEPTHYTPAQGSQRGRVGLLPGCGRGGKREHALQAATLRVLAAEGYEVVTPVLSGCCGITELQAGARQRALRHAQRTLDAFAAVGSLDHVISGAGACGLALKQYGRLLATAQAIDFSARTLDIHELLTRAPLRSRLGAVAIRAVLHDSCQLHHGQRASGAVRDLLGRVPGLELVALPATAGACCGATGIYQVSAPLAAAALGRRQAEAVIDTGAQLVLSTDSGCLATLTRHLRELGSAVAVRHPVELLALSITGAARA